MEQESRVHRAASQSGAFIVRALLSGVGIVGACVVVGLGCLGLKKLGVWDGIVDILPSLAAIGLGIWGSRGEG